MEHSADGDEKKFQKNIHVGSPCSLQTFYLQICLFAVAKSKPKFDIFEFFGIFPRLIAVFWKKSGSKVHLKCHILSYSPPSLFAVSKITVLWQKVYLANFEGHLYYILNIFARLPWSARNTAASDTAWQRELARHWEIHLELQWRWRMDLKASSGTGLFLRTRCQLHQH